MCKLAPAPRCAAHTSKELRVAIKNTKERASLAQDAAQAYDRVAFDPDSTHEQVLKARSVMNDALKGLEQAEKAQISAQEAFDTTPTGQKRLQEAIDASDSEVDKARLKQRLEKAQATREVQVRAGQLQSAADKALLHLDEEESKKLDALAQEHEKLEESASKSRQKISRLINAMTKQRQSVDVAQADMRESLQDVQAAHQEVRDYVINEYKKHGVSPENAEHYADDTVRSFQSGWGFVGPDSANDRVPVYAGQFAVKTKSGEHPDANSTQSTALSLEQDDQFRAIFNRVNEANTRYSRQVEVVKEGRRALAVKEQTVRTETSHYATGRDKAREAARKYKVATATVATGLDKTTTYEVDPQRFVGSAYRNADGSTNAYVLMHYGKKSAPLYVQVQSIDSDQAGSFMLLENGSKIYSGNMSAHDFKLIKPQEGATKLFNR